MNNYQLLMYLDNFLQCVNNRVKYLLLNISKNQSRRCKRVDLNSIRQ